MPRVPNEALTPAVNLTVSSAMFTALTAGTPGGNEELNTFVFCVAIGILSGTLLNFNLKEEKEVMFGRKEKENDVNWEERIKPGTTVENPVAAEQMPKAALPGRTATEAAKALAGIKALIESLQLTDEETWAKVRDKNQEALNSLTKMECRFSN